ncbi:hypothetical protein VTN49DRAFT_1505 [Thermomyces lanuginosus]|uniref:uncharacterized protein n=1 Tax=Thermomyces lanuginosus TaxID=5541 RepID=UPI003743F28C
MDDLLAPIQAALEGPIDFHGQRLANTLSTALLTVFGAIAFIVGYIQQDIHLTLWLGLAGTLITLLIVVPPYPFYNRNPEKWLDPVVYHRGSCPRVITALGDNILPIRSTRWYPASLDLISEKVSSTASIGQKPPL